ncbi:MAG: right-handed parallel beta-helix repeat-containing protein [Luteolibacter sp.]
MTLQEAREILGLSPHQDPRPWMDGLRAERENLAAMVRDAPNEPLAMRHQDDLVRFDRALATVRETLDALGLQKLPVTPEPPDEPPTELEFPDKNRRSPWLRVAAVLLFLAMAAAAPGIWFYLKNEDQKAKEFEARIASLDAIGNTHVENRRWDEAAVAFHEIQRLAPERPTGRLGLARIGVGIAEEHSQFIGYWTGEARAALDSGRWDDAETAARKVLERFPDQPDAVTVLTDIAGAKRAEARREAVAAATGLLDRGEFASALAAASVLETAHPADLEISELATRARTSLERQRADQARARMLFEQARARDTGEFDAEALEWLREAALLAPQDAEIAGHLEKMASYTRTIRVPEDVADLEEALANAREKDRIVLGPGTWRGVFVINLPIELQGAGPEETIFECPAIAGCALTLGPDAKGARITGITFRHIEFDPGTDRYSAALVRGGSVVFSDCHFIQASGHGLAVIEGAQVDVRRSRFRENGWNGIAATGNGTVVNVADSQANENFGHGVEAWSGARIALTRCRLEGNTGNGAHIDTTANDIRIESCDILANREFGIVLTATADGRVSKNRVHQNQLGGIAIRRTATMTRLAENEIFSNTGPGLLLDKDLAAAAYRDNTIQRNTGREIAIQTEPAPPVTD